MIVFVDYLDFGRGGQYLGKTFDIEKLGIPDHCGGKVAKPNIETAVADPKGLRLERRLVGFIFC